MRCQIYFTHAAGSKAAFNVVFPPTRSRRKSSPVVDGCFLTENCMAGGGAQGWLEYFSAFRTADFISPQPHFHLYGGLAGGTFTDERFGPDLNGYAAIGTWQFFADPAGIHGEFMMTITANHC